MIAGWDGQEESLEEFRGRVRQHVLDADSWGRITDRYRRLFADLITGSNAQ